MAGLRFAEAPASLQSDGLVVVAWLRLANWHLPLIARVYNLTWWQFSAMTLAGSIFLSLAFNYSGGSTLCAVLVHGIYNAGTGVILNEMIGKASLYDNPFNTKSFGWHTAA